VQIHRRCTAPLDFRFFFVDNLEYGLSVVQEKSDMPSQSLKRDESPFQVPVSCIADFVSSPGRAPESLIRPYKFSKRGEGAGRSSYYRFAINAIRYYHNSGRDPRVFQVALAELQKRSDDAKEKKDRVKCEKNIVAIDLYQRVYRNRDFKVLPNHRISYRLGQIRVTAQPDLWVEENGTQVLLKIGVARKKPSYVDVLLTIIRKAAVSSGHRRVRAKNVVYLNVSTGKEMICTGGLTRFNRTFKAIARDIARVWPKVTPKPARTADDSDVDAV
jgi:hypothetical protein